MGSARPLGKNEKRIPFCCVELAKRSGPNPTQGFVMTGFVTTFLITSNGRDEARCSTDSAISVWEPDFGERLAALPGPALLAAILSATPSSQLARTLGRIGALRRSKA
jgi:hypothetical protein